MSKKNGFHHLVRNSQDFENKVKKINQSKLFVLWTVMLYVGAMDGKANDPNVIDSMSPCRAQCNSL